MFKQANNLIRCYVQYPVKTVEKIYYSTRMTKISKYAKNHLNFNFSSENVNKHCFHNNVNLSLENIKHTDHIRKNSEYQKKNQCFMF